MSTRDRDDGPWINNPTPYLTERPKDPDPEGQPLDLTYEHSNDFWQQDPWAPGHHVLVIYKHRCVGPSEGASPMWAKWVPRIPEPGVALDPWNRRTSGP